MVFETLKKNNLKRNIIIGVVAVAIISTIILNFTRANYKETESIQIASGTIHYTAFDLSINSLYIDGEEAEQLDDNKTYTLDTENSSCTYKNGSEISNLTLSYDNETKSFSITPYTTKGTKCTLYFETDNSACVDGSFCEQLLADNPTQLPSESYGAEYSGDNTQTMFYAEGDQTEDVDGDGVGEIVYYFAGNALNNWVKFGKNSSNQDLYWRIVRTNEDGGVRLLYAGTSPTTTSAYIDSSNNYNDVYDDILYAGYMYGTSGSMANNRLNTNNSDIKTVVDNWYASGLNVKSDGTYLYDDYISKTAIYCNERAYEGEYFIHSNDTNNNMLNFAAGARINKTYKCGSQDDGTLYDTADVADKFSVSTASGGNGDLTYPIALITADELEFAGSNILILSEELGGAKKLPYYYYNANGDSITATYGWWTMTPSSYQTSYMDFINSWLILIWNYGVEGYNIQDSGDEVSGYVWGVASIGSTVTYAVRPVISLKSCVKFSSGDGSADNPYTVQIDSACAQAEN